MSAGVNKLNDSKGVTLIELIIALSLSSIVLVASFSVMTSMVQFQMEGGKKGAVTGWSLASLSALNRDIARSSTIAFPANPGESGNTLILCTNWSRKMSPPNGIRISAIIPEPTVIYYCYDNANHILRRLENAANCPNVGAAVPACTDANYPGGTIATAVYRIEPQASDIPIFINGDNMPNSVHIRMNIGKPMADNAGYKNPQYMTFDTNVVMDN
jgi:prepilin-type N-terminal cleavage/methylation domain-containing protein